MNILFTQYSNTEVGFVFSYIRYKYIMHHTHSGQYNKRVVLNAPPHPSIKKIQRTRQLSNNTIDYVHSYYNKKLEWRENQLKKWDSQNNKFINFGETFLSNYQGEWVDDYLLVLG